MSEYNIYPAVDGGFNFPPPIREAFADSTELTDAIGTAVGPAVNEHISTDPTVAQAAASLAQSDAGLVRSNTPGLPSQVPGDEILVSITDTNSVPTWLEAVTDDGGPSAHATKHIKNRVGIEEIPDDPDYLWAVTDANKKLTDLVVRNTDGQVPDWVIDRWKARMGGDSTPSTNGIVSPYRLAGTASLAQSQAAAVKRRIAGEAIPTGYENFTAMGEPSRLSFPTGYDDISPSVLVIDCHGRGDFQSMGPRGGHAEVLYTPGVVWLRSEFMDNVWGAPSGLAVMADAYKTVVANTPISGVVMMGNSMGGFLALNALTNKAVPNILGVYLVDASADLRHRWLASTSHRSEITAAYGIAADGSDYDVKTAGYDPMLAPVENFQGVPIRIWASSLDTTVSLALHSGKLAERLADTNDVDIHDVGTAGHNTADRFNGPDLKAFITKTVLGAAGLPQ